MNEEKVTIELDADRAIVLNDLLSRWEQEAGKPYPSDECFESAAEVRVLVDLLRDLEAELVAPLRSDYDAIVGGARARLAEGFEDMKLRPR